MSEAAASQAQKEAERQEALSKRVFTQGNLFFWTSLTALLVGALVQRAKERLQRLAPGELEPLGLATLDGERRLKLHHVLEICVAPEALQQRVRWRLCGVIMCV